MMAWVDMTLKQEFQFLSLEAFLWFSDPDETIIFYNKIIQWVSQSGPGLYHKLHSGLPGQLQFLNYRKVKYLPSNNWNPQTIPASVKVVLFSNLLLQVLDPSCEGKATPTLKNSRFLETWGLFSKHAEVERNRKFKIICWGWVGTRNRYCICLQNYDSLAGNINWGRKKCKFNMWILWKK